MLQQTTQTKSDPALDPALAATATRWLSDLEAAFAVDGRPDLSRLFVDDCHWRDILVFAQDIRTVSGVGAVEAMVEGSRDRARPSDFLVPVERVAPRLVTRSTVDVLEFLFECRAGWGPAAGVARLVRTEAGEWRAYTCMTALQDLDEHYAGTGIGGVPAFKRDFGGETWSQYRTRTSAFLDRDPTVLVIGGGQAGLGMAARLTQQGIDTLVVDRQARTGDNWRSRYDALVLHNQTNMNHLPFLPFPDTWPKFLPKDKLADWFLFYQDSMELNVWTGTSARDGRFDEANGRWEITVCRDGEEPRTMRPRHIVFATGTSSIPVRPALPGLDDFAGTVMHSGEYRNAQDWHGKKAIVVGSGNSAHDVAQDLASNGALVTMVQRSPTYIISLEQAQKLFTLYDEGLAVDDADLVSIGTPFLMLLKACRKLTAEARDADAPLLHALEEQGFKLTSGEDDGGFQPMILRRAGGYCFNVGCSDLIADGTIKIVPSEEVARYDANGMTLLDGSKQAADLIVLATGYRAQQETVRAILGCEVADRVGPIWGLDEMNELRNMWRPTAQPNLWFTGGGLAQCRVYSHFIALQIRKEIVDREAPRDAD